MNVLFIGLYPPHIGGIATHTSYLKKGLEMRGHNVSVVTYGHSGISQKDVYGVSTWPFLRGISFIKNACPLAQKVVSEKDIDIIHSHYLTPPGYVGARVRAKTDVPAVVTAHGSDINFLYNGHVGKRLIDRALDRTDAIICVSRSVEKKISAITDVPTHYIPNGVDLEAFCPSEEEKSYVLYVGALTQQKRVCDLVDALAGTGEKLVVAGDGHMRPRLEWLASKRGVEAEFIGYSTDVPALMRKAKLLVLPSEDEGFGLAILEAMASGVPAIGRDIPAIREIVVPGENGLLFKDVRELHDLIVTLELDCGLREKLVKNGLETAKRFSWDSVTDETVKIYKDVIESHNGST